MKKHILCAVLALGTATARVSLAQSSGRNRQAPAQPAAGQAGQLPAEAQQRIQQHYPGAQITEQGAAREENGVRVYNIQITPKGGQPFTAEATEHGDFLASATRQGTGNLPAAVQEVVQNIWKNPPQDVQEYVATFYLVDIGGSAGTLGRRAEDKGSRTYQLRFDSTGRLLDVKSPSQLQQANWRNMPDAQGDVHQRLQQWAQTRYAASKAKIDAIKQMPADPGTYTIRMTINGQDAWAETDANGQISTEASTVQRNELPRPVTDALNNTFKGDRVVWSARQDQHFYQVRENVGNETIVLRVQPDGDVLSVRTIGAGQGDEATTAGHRAQGSRNNQNSGNAIDRAAERIRGQR